MLKFFRNIRRNLIKDKRIGNYLIYALGEILLVMVGILLALQVNQWANNQAKTNKRDKLAAGLLAELKSLRNITNHFLTGIERQQTLILYLVNNDEIEMDSVKKLSRVNDRAIPVFDCLFRFVYHLNPRSNVYNTAVSDGSLSLFENPFFLKNLSTSHNFAASRIEQHVSAEIEINDRLIEHVSSQYKEDFRSGEIKDIYGSWDETTVKKVLGRIHQDGKLKYLLSAKLHLLHAKHGDTRWVILTHIEKSINFFEEYYDDLYK